VSAFEVESVLQQFPGVGEVAVVGVPSELGEDDIKAFVIPAVDAALQPEALHEWCSAKMTAFKVPRYIEIVEDFPRSATKREVERAQLRTAGHSTAWDAEAAGRVPRGQQVSKEAGNGSR
jgi:crotonobetaine/carnitine-CoA ligase